MRNINTSDLLTAKQVAEQVGMPVSAANSMLKAIEPALKAGNTRMWDVSDVKSYLYGMHEELFTFMGVRPPDESYDSVITELSTEEV